LQRFKKLSAELASGPYGCEWIIWQVLETLDGGDLTMQEVAHKE
jgi:hypothetical protein